MANTLMFEVGVSESVKGLEKVRNLLEDFRKDYTSGSKALKLKVSIDNIQQVTNELSKIGDTPALRNLRNEIALLNKEFSILAKGAGGAGSIVDRGLAADIEKASQSIDRYTAKIEELKAARSALVGGKRNANYDLQTSEIERYTVILEGARKKLADLEAQKNKPSSDQVLRTTEQEVQGYQKVVSAIETLTGAVGTLKSVLGSWTPNQGNISSLVEQFGLLREKIAAAVTELGKFDPSKLNASGVNIDLGKVSGISDLNAAIRSLEISINSIIQLFSNLTNAIKLQPMDESVKALIERAEKAEQKLREVGDAAKYLNEQAGKKTQQKASNIAGIAGVDEEQANKVTNTYERFLRLLVEIENHMSKIGKVQLLSDQSGIDPVLLKQAVDRFEKLHALVDFAVKGRELANGISIPQTNDQLAQFIASFNLLKASYKDVLAEADKYNKETERKEKDLTRQIEREEKERKRIYEKSEKDRQALVEQSAKRIRDIESSITRGLNAGRDMSNLEGARSRLAGLSSLLSITSPNDSSFARRMKDVKDLMADVDLLRKAEERLTAARERANKAQDKADTKKLNDEIKSVNDAWIKYDELAAKIKELHDLRSRGEKANIDLTRIDSAISKYEHLKLLMAEVIRGSGRSQTGKLASEIFGGANYKMITLDAKAATRSYARMLDDIERRMRAAGSSARQLGKYVDDVEAKRVDFKGLDTSRFDAALQRIRDIRAELERFSRTGMSPHGTNAQDIMHDMGLSASKKEVSDAIAHLNRELRQNEQNAQAAANATVQLTESEQRLANAIKSSTDSMSGQSQVLSDLKMMAMQYLSVWGAQNFINKIIETGGQLEQQRLSMGAILQDSEKANEIFEQIKALAIKSPFGVVQLDQMSKQLAAYSFEADELYEWTKRLADISAATGTEVSRLSLALGHVRSEGALSGYTLRQFSMGNVPLLRMLSENRGVSTKEIRDLVRKKLISDKEVMDVLRQLTDNGGMFYEAQEVMSGALNARFKNLRDAFDIMYGEMAEGAPGDVLKEIAIALTDVAKQWKRFGADMLWIVGILGTLKVATTAYSMVLGRQSLALGRQTAATLKSTLAAKKQEAQLLKLASRYRQLEADEVKLIASRNRLTASQLKTLLVEKKLTLEDLKRSVALRQVSKDEAVAAARMAGMNVAAVQSVRVLSRSRVALINLGVAIKSVGAMLKSFLPMLALGAVVDLFQRKSSQTEASTDMAEGMVTPLLHGLSRVNELYGQLSAKHPVGIEETEEAIKNMTKALMDSGNYSDELRQQVEGAETLADKYKILYLQVEQLSEKYLQAAESAKAYFAEANNTGGSFISDDMLKNMQQLNSSFIGKESAKRLASRWAANLKIELRNMLQSSGEWLSDYEGLGWSDIYNKISDSNVQKFQRLMEALKTSESSDSSRYKIADSFLRYADALDDYVTSLDKVKAQMPNYANMMTLGIGEILGTEGVDINKMSEWGEKEIRAYVKALEDAIAKYSFSSQVSKKLRNMVLEQSGLSGDQIRIAKMKVVPEIVDNRSAWQKEMQEAFDDNGIEIEIREADNRDDIIKRLKEMKKDLQEKVDRDGKILLGLGITVDEDEESKTLEQKVSGVLAKVGRSLKSRNKFANATASEYKKNRDTLKGLNNVADIFHLYLDEKDKKTGQQDPVLEMWKKRISLLDKYRQELDSLSKIMNRAAAESKLREDGGFGALWEYFTNPNDYGASIQQAISSLGTGGKRKEYVDELGGKQTDENMRRYTDSVKDSVSELSRLLSIQKENYDVYKKWLDLTGSDELASRVAGVMQNSTLQDVLRGKYGESGGYNGMTADAFFGLSESQAKLAGQDSALFKLWEQWQENVKKLRQEDLALYEEAIKNAQGYAEKVDAITRALEREKKALDAVGGADAERLKANADKNAREKIAKLTWDNFKDTEEWGRVFGDLDKMSTTTLTSMLEKLRSLAPTVKESTEATKALYEAIAKIEKVTASRSPLSTIFGSLTRANRLRQLRRQGTTTMTAESARYYGLTEGVRYSPEQLSDEIRSSETDFVSGLKGLSEKFQAVQDAVQPVIDLFDKLGQHDISDYFQAGSNALGAAANVSSSLTALGLGAAAPYGAIAAAGMSIAGSIIAAEDAAIQRQIAKTQEQIDAINANTDAIKRYRSRELGYDSGTLRRNMSQYWSNTLDSRLRPEVMWMYGDNYSKMMMRDYYTNNSSGNGYTQELKNLRDERDLILKQHDLESSRKDSDSKALEEYRKKIAELDEQIMYFTEDLAKELWDIDIKGWADQIGDALWTAFENGEDAVKAFESTADDIISNVAKKMLNIGFIEPLMNDLQSRLFGQWNATSGMFEGGALRYTKDSNGSYNIDMAGSQQDVLAVLGNFRNQASIFAAAGSEFYDWVQKITGIDFSEDATSSPASSSVKSITEQTANLLASYVNAIRADVSVDRSMIAQYFPMYYSVLTSCNSSLRNLETRAMEIAKSNEAISRNTNEVVSLVTGLKNKTWKVPVS